MKARNARRATSPTSAKSAPIGVAGPHRWSRDLLQVTVCNRLRTPCADLGQVDEGLVNRVGRKPVAVLVADLSGAESIRVIERLHRIHPKIAVMALSVPEGNGDVVSLVQSGVTGIVPLNGALAELIADLRYILRSAGTCTPRVADMLARYIGSNSSRCPGRRRELSPREIQVAKLLAEGLPNKLIADALHISQGTVKNHIHRILEKMSIKKRADIPGRLPQVQQQGPTQETSRSPSK